MVELVNKRKRWLSSYVFKYLFFYLFYLGCFIFLFSSLTSIVVFFHFLLDHRFVIIDDWIYRHSWSMIIVTKLISGYILFRFINLKVDENISFQKFIYNDFNRWSSQVLVAIVFIFISMIWVGRPKASSLFTFDTSYFLASYFGNIAFYFIDYLIMAYLKYLYPMRRKRERGFSVLSFSIIFYLVSMISFPFAENLSVLVWLHMLTGFVILEVARSGWFFALLYYCLIAGPLSSIFGMDPIWADHFSPYIMTQGFNRSFILGIWPVAIGYLWKHRQAVRNRPVRSTLTQ